MQSMFVRQIVAKAKSSRQPLVVERVRAGLCLFGFFDDEVPTCDCEAEDRGRCYKHYVAWLREYHRRVRLGEDAEDYVRESIREGRILDKGEWRRLRNNNPDLKVGAK